MNCEKVFGLIDKLADEYTNILADICRIESPTDYKEGVDAVGRYLMEIAKKRGWDIEVCPQEISGDAMCFTINPDAKKPAVVFSGHMDTVHPVGSFDEPIVRIEDGRMYGPGTTDCKGGVVSSLLALDALCQSGFSDRPVKVVLQSDEEKSSMPSGKQTIKFMCEKAKGAAAFLNAEGLGKNAVVIVRKGILRLKLTVHGKAAHSGFCYNGASAIAEAAHKILELEKLKEVKGITCNCGVIKGGSVGNVVPEWCEFIADIRYATVEEMERAYEIVRNLANTSFIEGCTCAVEEVSSRPPMEYTERNAALLKRMNEIYKAHGMPEFEHIPANGGSDAAYVTISEIPCVDSVGVNGGLIHNRGEYVIIDSIAEAAKRMAAVAVEI